jgi:predicted RNA methylase
MALSISKITMPNLSARVRRDWLADLSLRLRTYRSLLDRLPAKSRGGTLVDLGCGPGMFARVALRKGFRVTAVDVRAPWALDGSPLPEGHFAGMEFQQADARDFDVSGFDIVAIIGLIYHLTLAEQIALLARCREKIVFVDTEIYDSAAMSERSAQRIRTPAESLGYDGVEWLEQDRVWSSSGNSHSFWHTDASQLRLFENTGFRDVAVVEPAYSSPHGPRRWYLLNAADQPG